MLIHSSSLLRSPPPLFFSSLIFIGCPFYRPELFLSFMCAIISPLSLYIQFTHHLLHHLFAPSSASPITLTRLTLTLIRLTLHPQGHCSHSLKTQLHYHFSFHHHCKLVTKVHSLQFVEMKEFLHDNVLLGKRLDAMGATALLGPAWGSTAKPANMRDVPSLISWISCFTTYIAILGEALPHLVRSRLAYYVSDHY